MSVLVEAISVIVRKDAITAKYPGGVAAFRADVPNDTFCDDGQIIRVGFMSPEDVQGYIEGLGLAGLTYLSGGMSIDLTVADQQRGLMARCDWAECFRVPIFSDDGPRVTICAFEGKLDGSVELPDGWAYEDSLYAGSMFIHSDASDTAELVSRRNNLETWRTPLSRKTFYRGRTGRNDDIDAVSQTRRSKMLTSLFRR